MFVHPSLGARLRLCLLVLLLALGLLAGCSWPTTTAVYESRDARLEVLRLTGQPAADPPRAAELASLSPEQIQRSLSRVTVRLGTWVSFLKGDPEPLFSQDQRERLGPVLARELPGLAPTERLVLVFEDASEGYEFRVRTYLSGEALVYDFEVQGRLPNLGFDERRRAASQAKVIEQPGQILGENREGLAVLRDPIASESALAARTLREKLALVDEAAGKGLLSDEDAEALRERIRSEPGMPLHAWETYMRRRTALEQARLEGLFSEAEYTERLQEIEAELEAAAEEAGGGATGG